MPHGLAMETICEFSLGPQALMSTSCLRVTFDTMRYKPHKLVLGVWSPRKRRHFFHPKSKSQERRDLLQSLTEAVWGGGRSR